MYLFMCSIPTENITERITVSKTFLFVFCGFCFGFFLQVVLLYEKSGATNGLLCLLFEAWWIFTATML